MKKRYLISEFIIIGIIGTLWHFVYDWSGKNAVIGAFFPVNESTWEHLKLIFFPAVIYTVTEFFCLKVRSDSYIPAAVTGIFAGMLAITVFFYTYLGILRFLVPFLNILSFFIGIFIMLWLKNRLLSKGLLRSKAAVIISIVITLATAVLFVVWSFNPPALGIFIPPEI